MWNMESSHIPIEGCPRHSATSHWEISHHLPSLSQGPSVSANHEAVLPPKPVCPYLSRRGTYHPFLQTLHDSRPQRGGGTATPFTQHSFGPINLMLSPFGTRPGRLWSAEWLTLLLSQRRSDPEDQLALLVSIVGKARRIGRGPEGGPAP